MADPIPAILQALRAARTGVPRGSDMADPTVARALKYVEGQVKPDGGVYQENSLYRNYETCLAIMCFEAANADGRYQALLDRAERYDIDESSIDDLVSAVRVTYYDSLGRTQYLDVTDTDTDHPLVALGITRYGQVSAQTSSTATASAIGTVYLQENGRTQAQGSVTTRYVMTANGAEVYLPSIRPGRMCRLLGLPDGYKDCIVKRVTCTGDEVATIELDNSPYRLDVLLARLGGSGE